MSQLRGSLNNNRNQSDSDLEYGSEIAKLTRDMQSRRINGPKKPSAFKSSSSNSSKRKQVGFEDCIRQSGRNLLKSSHHQKLTNSQGKECPNESDLFIEDVESQKGEEEDSRILIHVSTQGKMRSSQLQEEVNYLKQLQKATKKQLIQLGKTMKKMNAEIARQFQNQLSMYRLRVQRQCQSQKNIMKQSLISIQKNLKDKTSQNINLAKELQELRSQKRSWKKIDEDSIYSGKSLGVCPNCKLYEIKINSIREDALNSAQTISKLQLENERLQETIFDLEQKVVGIDLIVEKKLKVALEDISGLQPLQKDMSKQIMENMAKDIEKLTLQCKYYQNLCKKEDELQRKEADLNAFKNEYERKNESLLEAIARNQQTIDRNYEREHKLLMAEEEFFKKFQDIRQKEIELSKWEAALTEKSIQSNKNCTTFKPHLDGKAEEYEISLTNIRTKDITNQPQDIFTQYRVTLPPKPNHGQQESHIGRVSLPQEYEPRTYQKPRYQDSIKESRKYNPTNNYGNNIYSSKIDLDYQSRKINPSYSNKNFHHRSNLVERASGVNSRSKYETRKVSPYLQKGSSPAKSFRSSNVSHLVRSNIKHNDNINGLENKLDRLRDQLKKELESIK